MTISTQTQKIRLHGFPISNYYNRIKMALQLKGLSFEEVRTSPSKESEYLKINPLGVIPTLEIDGVFFAETHPTIEYLDEAYPDTTPLLPQDAIDRHRVRQIVNYIDMYIDRPLRTLRDFQDKYSGASDALIEMTRTELEKGIESLNRTVRFKPYIAGNEISAADCAAYCTLPWFAYISEQYLGENLLHKIQGFDEYKAFLDQNNDFVAIHTAAAKAIKLLERAKKFAGGKL
ncbi:MAG TPA: glutathione S-transferase family protein [Turneriella sp.]|nr:glutathione S-transferase family protein [Turneriella sp.]